MTKTTKTTKTAAFNVGDLVSVTTAATLGNAASGEVAAVTASGWFVIELDQPIDHPSCKDGKVSARASSLTLRDDTEAEEINGEYSDDLDENGNEIELDEELGIDITHEELDEVLEEAETAAHKMAEALRKARAHYTKDRRPSGAATAHNGDLIAKELRDYEPLEVAALADRCLSTTKGFHADRYSSLNNGQIRMNCGNKIRAAYRKACEADASDATMAELKARIEFVLGLDTDEE